MNTRALGFIVGLLASNALSATESGSQLQWSVDTAVSHTNNATLVDTDPISETIGSVGGAIDLTRAGSRLNATLRGAGSYLSYFDNTYSNDFLGSGAASILFGLVGDTLSWTLDDTFGQSTTNEFEPSTPDNRGNINVVSTGPDLRLLLGSATELVVTGRYQDSSYEDAGNVDNHSWTGEAAVVRRVSPAVSGSFNVAASRTVYDDTAGDPDSNEQEVFVQLEANGARQTLTADLGIGFLDQGDQTEQTPLVRINWTRRLTPSWSLALDASSEYLNSADQFVAGVADGPELGGTQDIILTNEVPRDDAAALSLGFERPRTTFSISGGVTRESYPDSASSLDRRTWAMAAEASRLIAPRLEATLETDYEKRDFTGTNEDDKTTTITARIDWRVGKDFFLGLEGGTQRRSGNTGFEYDETAYQLSLSYKPFAR
jgi:hypothetical protein